MQQSLSIYSVDFITESTVKKSASWIVHKPESGCVVLHQKCSYSAESLLKYGEVVDHPPGLIKEQVPVD